MCCLCKRSSRQTTLVCVNAPRRDQRLPLRLHLAAEITDTCSPSLYINLQLAQIDNLNHSISYAHFGCVHHMNNIECRFCCSSVLVENMERCLEDLIIRMIYVMTCRKGLSIYPLLLFVVMINKEQSQYRLELIILLIPDSLCWMASNSESFVKDSATSIP
jgi:hypothetical protein